MRDVILGLFRAPNRRLIARLHGEIVAAARAPTLFTAYAIEDTFEGRFESVTLHAALVLRRLNVMPAPAPAVAQDLADAIFQHFEIALREMGVGDTVVPKRMKTLAEAFLGRSTAYDEALRGRGDSLQVVLARNVYAGRNDAARLVRYIEVAEGGLTAAPIEVFLEGPVPFPDPAMVMQEFLP